MLARGGFYSGRYFNTSGQTVHQGGGIIGVGNNPVNNSNNLIQLDPRRPAEPASSSDAILYRRASGPEPSPTGNSSMFSVERNGDVIYAGSLSPSDAKKKKHRRCSPTMG